MYVPYTAYRCDIFVREIREFFGPSSDPDVIDAVDIQEVEEVIAHELGHGVSLVECSALWCIMQESGNTGTAYTDGSHDHRSEYDLVYGAAVPW